MRSFCRKENLAPRSSPHAGIRESLRLANDSAVGPTIAYVPRPGGNDDGTRYDGSVGSDALGNDRADGHFYRFAIRRSQPPVAGMRRKGGT